MNNQPGYDLGAPSNAQILERLETALVAGRVGRRDFVRIALGAGLATQLGTLDARAGQLEEIQANQAERIKNLLPTYDYIVCGSGSAGCAVAGNLATDRSINVLLIEAGDWDTVQEVLDPRIWFTNLGTSRDWGDVALPSPGVNDRAIPQHTARVLGGGSSINATIWARPFKGDLDYWAAASGDPSWTYEHGLSIFRRVENWQGKPDERYRGKNGPVWCQPAHDPHPLAHIMLAACQSLGLPVLDDLNGVREEQGSGFALMNQIIRDGQRHTLAKAYLYPVLAQKNITLLLNTDVERLKISGDRVTGVLIRDGNGVREIRAEHEVIVSTGGINTPKLLMLSGIGDQSELKAQGIKTVFHAPEVGKNYQDHILHGGCLWESPDPIKHRNSGAEASGFWKSAASGDVPDVNVVQIELPYASPEVAKKYNPPASSWALCAGLVNPKSRGQVRLRSANAADRPVVDANFLGHPDDLRSLSAGIELCREIGNAPALRAYAKREVAPGKKLVGGDLRDFMRNGATTYFHASGTCRMGSDTEAVVDARLRVNGVRNLRIADSSIMPRIVSCPTMAACVLIGERLVEILKQEA